MPVHNPTQLKVLLSFDPNSQSSTSESSYVPISSSIHLMKTRLKTWTISKKDYSAYSASSSQVDSVLSKDIVLCGYTVILDVHKANEPTSYKSAITSIHWREAMTEEFTALQK